MKKMMFIIFLGVLALVFAAMRTLQWTVLAATAASWLFLSQFVVVSNIYTSLFWLVWVIMLVVSLIARFQGGFIASLAAVAVGVILMTGGTLSASSTPAENAAADTTSVTYSDANGEQQVVDVVDDQVDQKQGPVVGEDTSNDEATRPTLDCQLPLGSLSELVECVDSSPKKDEFIKYFDSNKGALGASWDQIVDLAKKEVDTRAIVVANSGGITDEQARQLVVDAGVVDTMAEAEKMAVVRVDGAIINTTAGAVGEKAIKPYADNREQIRVILTAKPGDEAAAYAAAGRGVLVECSNVATGVIPRPAPRPKQEAPKKEQPAKPQPKPTPTTPTEEPTPTPTTPTEEPTDEPTPTPTTPTEEPTEEPTPTPTCPPWEDGTTPPPNEDGTCPKDENAGPDSPPEHTPAPSPTGPAETEAPAEPEPADPTDQPGDPVPSVPAPGATQEPVPTSAPVEDPEPSSPATGDVDPDGATNPSPDRSYPEDPVSSDETVSTDGNATPSGEAESEAPDINDVGGAAASLGLLLPFFRRKSKRQH